MIRGLPGTILRAGLLAMLLGSCAAALAAARSLDLAPHVGDIVVFGNNRHFEADWRIDVTRVGDSARCVLQPGLMMRDGGSLVVEQRTVKADSYRVHWAGEHTAAGNDDCGAAADLTLNRVDLQILINAAGGAGVEPKAFPELW